MYRIGEEAHRRAGATPTDDDKSASSGKRIMRPGPAQRWGWRGEPSRSTPDELIPVKRHKFPYAHCRAARSPLHALRLLMIIYSKVWQWIVYLTLPFRKFISFIGDDKEKARSWRWLRFLFPHLQLITY
jgi:hypothetical protein